MNYAFSTIDEILGSFPKMQEKILRWRFGIGAKRIMLRGIGTEAAFHNSYKEAGGRQVYSSPVHHENGHTLKEIASFTGLSAGAILKLEKRALQQMRQPHMARSLEGLFANAPQTKEIENLADAVLGNTRASHLIQFNRGFVEDAKAAPLAFSQASTSLTSAVPALPESGVSEASLKSLFDRLTEREETVIRMRFGIEVERKTPQAAPVTWHGQTLNPQASTVVEIAQHESVTRTRIDQNVAHAMRVLRHHKKTLLNELAIDAGTGSRSGVYDLAHAVLAASPAAGRHTIFEKEAFKGTIFETEPFIDRALGAKPAARPATAVAPPAVMKRTL